MTTFRPITGVATLLVPIALIVAACSGTAASGSPGASSGTGAATSTPAVPGPPSAGAGAAASGGGAIPSFDISALTAGLTNLDSYKVAITVAGQPVYTGTVVNKPVLSRDLTVSGGTRIVVIGDEAWVAQGGGPLASVPETMANGLFATYDPSLLVGAFGGLAWAQSSQDMGAEQKNGIDAHHYHIDFDDGRRRPHRAAGRGDDRCLDRQRWLPRGIRVERDDRWRHLDRGDQRERSDEHGGPPELIQRGGIGS